ncbi:MULTISPECIES: SDR family oxidoreductase [Bordetella]|uniref:3-oxoacyl-ACP reductase n=1 Tax=Bordetella genomosp. 6 TaxID=463024 RepID=A0ABX4FCC4_9BORD|nr:MULTISPECIES: SDR family oxidoreductase [Bordetella]AOB27460.1 3-oxoacyl-ACP reductase [Bordetella bronchiseptica]ARP77184.1 3-oxoacyl-ACP reductase [Bordetella genomosp. 6]AZW44773.1 3-oxoacyl-ACP reductase [Bordetella bronchiseptica]KCV63629.1 KR domain protein [Bordetella bronchiseptica 99-R-0433]MBN3270278.1 3-oxoacyl-ACP reductase [Bordetella bronchiseptica]
MKNDRLQGRVALVTGGAGGIGLAVCRRLQAEGARIVVGDIGEERVLAAAAALGGQAFGVFLDVADRQSWAAAKRAVDAQGWQVDIVVNVAGIVRDRSLAKMSDAEWSAVIDVNLRGTWLGCQSAFAWIGERGWGRIINVASTAIFGAYGQANYSAAKAGIVGLTRTAALEGAKRGILVNAVAPGIVETSILADVPDQVRAGWLARMPLKRTAQPEEIAAVIAFLASDDASYMTGQTLVVDGGATTGDY